MRAATVRAAILVLLVSQVRAQVAPPQLTCEANGCAPRFVDVNQPPQGLDFIRAFKLGSQKGTCVCLPAPGESTIECRLEADCQATPEITILALPGGTSFVQNVFTQGTGGTPGYNWFFDLVVNCVAVPPVVSSTAPKITKCALGVNNPVGGNPWLFNISGYGAEGCGADADPLWTWHCYGECPPCSELDSTCRN